jgi:hypothetical protein
MQAEGAGAFWSYVHADDEADGGRIVELGRDVQRQYGLLTGGKLDLFLDRDALEWGDDWRERVAEALSAATAFIPVMTPRYFDSAECRRELITFAREANRLGVESLLRPILYVRVPDLERDDLADEAMILVRPRQYEDWTSLRFDDRASADYRKGVALLAQRLADTVQAVSSLPAALAEPAESQSPRGQLAEDESPGVLDLLAAGEDAMPRWRDVIDQLNPAFDQLTAIVQRGAAEMEASDARGAGATGRLQAATRVASQMREPVAKILRLGEGNTREVAIVDAALDATLDAIGEHPPADAAELEQVLQFFDATQGMVAAAATSAAGLEELSRSMSQSARISRVFRPVARDLQRGLRGFVDAQAIYDEWDRRIREIRKRLDESESPAS